MGLYVESLNNIPEPVDRDYFIYLLDYGWNEPLGEALRSNFDEMAKKSAQSRAVIIKGTDRTHFQNEVFSWHHINGLDADNILPALLITNCHPRYFRDNNDNEPKNDTALYRDTNSGKTKLILIPFKSFCKTTLEVIDCISQIFKDISEGKDISNFEVKKQITKGNKGAFFDALILEPNFSGIGINLKKLFQK